MRYCFSRSLAARQSIRRRLVHALLVALFVFGLSWGSDARADAPIFSNYQVQYFGTYNGSSPAAACQAAATAQFVTYVSVSAINPANWSFTCTFSGGPTSANGAAMNGTCATGATPNKTLPLEQQCPSAGPDCASAELLNKYRGAGVEGPSLTETAPGLICVQGCGYVGGSVMVTFPKAGGAYTYSGRLGAATGQACTTANYDIIDTVMYDQTKDERPPSPLSCSDQGKVYGTVNGVGICANAGTIPGSTVTTNETKTSTQTDASGVQAQPQTETTTYSVGNVNGVAVVTSTVTHADGSKTQVTQTQDGFCRENPSASPCGGGGGGGGGGGKKDTGIAEGGDTCQAQPVCSGDAIQCMMVKQQWFTRCEPQAENPMSQLGQQILDGNDPKAGENPVAEENREKHSLNGAINQSAFLAAGGLQDKTFRMSGRMVVFPFSKLNEYLVMIGNVFVAISLIGAARIVVGVK